MARNAKYIGPRKGKKIHSAAIALKLMRDPRQEFWKGLPPQRHRVRGFEKLPGVKDVARKGYFAKYVFNRDGSKTYIYYQK